MSSSSRLPLLIVGVALGAAACTSSGAASPRSSASPAPTSAPSPSTGGIAHPTGGDEIILRYEEGGGFMMPDFLVTLAPIFTLYGDGTVVFRDPNAAPPPGDDGLMRGADFRTATLSEEQIQALLEFAATEGGLGVARERYDHNGVADAGTALFTINAGGQEKQVSVYALGIDGPGTPDEAMRRQFQALAERLRTFDEGGAIPTAVYKPTAWRGVLIDAPGVAARTIAWPWDGIGPDDFKAPADPNVTSFPTRVMTAEEVEALGLGTVDGGVNGIFLKAPDGKTYSFALRPLLPDEEG